MILTDGAILQSGKYVIQAVLHKADLGMTYQAYHVYLEQTVVLQTLNPTAKQSNHPQVWQQIVQQFMSGARHLAKHPFNHRLRAIDLFQEQVDGQNLPFVVLSFLPNQPPQKLGEWFVYLPEPTPPEATLPQTATQSLEPQSLEPLSEAPAASKPEPVQAAIPPVSSADESTSGTTPAEVTSPAPIAEPAPHPVAATEQLPQTFNGQSPQKQSSPSVRILVQPKPRAAKWIPARLPNAFLLTALIAGATGAGMGFALRVQPPSQGKTPFNLGTSFFTREQSFPAQGNWPIYETPSATMPEATDNSPTYPAEPALQYTPPLEPFSEGYAPLPAAPAQLAPAIAAPENVTPSNSTEAVPAESNRPSDVSPANKPAPPVTSQITQPSQPAPVAPAPVVAEPLPIAPAPVVEPAPAAPPPLSSRPKTIDQ
ncbi:hypothetical protein [Leptolyngbya sp. ST-U4]|uniref:hypothetical protein n=1 Tax=Leptolyngbya sp. ST-U4 TaxID=2933912 RepID=UPI0019AAA7D7|nr:hypothetical protein [Cyanobacteria bacterium FACHB-502]